MYVCMCVCMYVCTYVRTYVRIYMYIHTHAHFVTSGKICYTVFECETHHKAVMIVRDFFKLTFQICIHTFDTQHKI